MNGKLLVMLIKIWERIRGIDKWPETTATVTSVNYYSASKAGDLADVGFRYRDAKGEDHYGSYTVDSMTSLYNINADDTFSVWYNPKKPDQNFSDEIEGTANRRLLIILSAVGMLLLVAISLVFHR